MYENKIKRIREERGGNYGKQRMKEGRAAGEVGRDSEAGGGRKVKMADSPALHRPKFMIRAKTE